MLRAFEKTVVGSSPGANGTPAYVIRCSECGASEVLRAGKRSGSLNTSFIYKKLAQNGWHVGRSSRHDVCPACSNRGRKQHTSVEETDMSNVTQITQITPQADPPPQMTKEDRRIIFSKIDENYIDEKSGYAGQWNDERIAKDLNVPRAWVSEIREANFGPEIGETIGQDIKIVEDAIEAARKAVKEMDDKIERMREAYHELSQRMMSERETFAVAVRDALSRLDRVAKRR